MEAEDGVSLLSVKSLHTTSKTITKIVKRLRAMTLKLLPVEVDPEELKKPSSSIINPKVISSFQQAAGDYAEALPYALLRARQTFMAEANSNPADYDENLCRAIACEVLARRIVHLTPADRMTSIMSTRYCHIQRDGDDSSLSSALELAIDQHCTIFLSSSEAQYVVNCLWRGEWIQVHNARNDIDYVPFEDYQKHSFSHHFHPSRLAVPRYQNIFNVIIWIFYLFVYSQAVQQPVERINPRDEGLSGWELILYIMALAFSLQETSKVYKTLRLFTWRAFGFWTIISLITDSLLMAAFVMRMIGIATPDSSINYHFLSFQVLSFVSPFIWMKLVTVVDGYKYIGTMQICVGRMLQESTIFFLLLSILAIGFAQGLYALDAADGQSDHTMGVINSLIQALLQAPVFGGDITGSGPALGIYYLWNFVTSVVLLNILISLFSSAYEDVVDDAEAEFLAFFAGKTIGMIRAPDVYVYPAPFSLIELFLVVPFEFFISKDAYDTLNKYIMTLLFFIPLTLISLWESLVESGSIKNRYMASWLLPVNDGNDDSDAVRNPKVDREDHVYEDGHNVDGEGLEISKVSFDQLTKVFPNPVMSNDTLILNEINDLKKMIEDLQKKLN